MSSTRSLLLLAYLWIAFVPFAYADSQSSSLDSLASNANSAYTAKDWDKARPLYQQLTQVQPENPRYWYRLGVSLQATGQHQKALDALQKARDKGVPVSIVGYNLAGVFASLGQTDKAFAQLAEAVKQGYSHPDQMNTDPDLASLRSDPRFAGMLEQTRHNQTPCDYTAENRQFDFWVGDWNVVTTRGAEPAGISHIERTIGDCVIWENWTSLGNSGYEGKSYNTYNASLKRWEQFWADNIGGMIHFYGGLKDGVMDFYTDELPQSDGTKLQRHLQFFNLGPDKVRQFSQGSTDSGKTWTVEYDFTYNRKK